MLANGGVCVREDHAFVCKLFLKRTVDHFRFELSLHTGEVLTLGFWDTQFLERVFDLFGNVVPAFTLFVGWFQVVVDVLKIEIDIAAPFRHRLAVEDLQRFKPELEHPIRFFFDFRNLSDDFFINSFTSLEDRGRLGLEVVLVDVRGAKLLVFGHWFRGSNIGCHFGTLFWAKAEFGGRKSEFRTTASVALIVLNSFLRVSHTGNNYPNQLIGFSMKFSQQPFRNNFRFDQQLEPENRFIQLLFNDTEFRNELCI